MMAELGPMITILLDAFWAAVAALGFAVLFNAPRRALPAILLAGALGHATHTALVMVGVSVEIAVLAGALLIGLLGEFFQRRMRIPRVVFTVPGVIPMVPGSLAFGAMEKLLGVLTAPPDVAAELLARASVDIIHTGFILMALAVGISVPILFRHQKPAV